jgi:hypothetical protein
VLVVPAPATGAGASRLARPRTISRRISGFSADLANTHPAILRLLSAPSATRRPVPLQPLTVIETRAGT